MTIIASIVAAACLALLVGRMTGRVPQHSTGGAFLGLIVCGVLGAGWVFPLLPLVFVGWVVLGPARREHKRSLKAARRAHFEGRWQQMADTGAGQPCCDNPMPHRHRPYEPPTADTPRRRRPYDPPGTQTRVAGGDQGLLQYAADTRLPESSRERIGALHDRLAEAVKYVKERNLDSGLHGFNLEQIRDDFAPNAIKTFLALPPSTARTTVIVDGKTGEVLLNEQLDLLIKGVDQQLVSAAMASGDEMVASERFLREKFGPRPADLDLD
ncbi:hypothetical protein ATK17_3156 [Branchiibius hedensis]|uniref:Uncharacterized protein n=1 Tax=Branchiibius hedensis TaxID=672460 RepID=A0A2Y8ZUS0_9MICO|nr:hypothetical protein [Branchiibius hedensis]PWJ26973.1 hypothetical protein ATK17_3156 [Branchiibius hedensis]SSA35784.1 hypothetical protein SAMN04489750_3156 [Branchiibius hedensis]